VTLFYTMQHYVEDVGVRTDPGKSWKRHRSWKTLEKSWGVVVLEILILVLVSLTREEIHCNTLC